MKITYNSEHRSTGKNNPATKGQTRYNYSVGGTKEELADFKKSQGQFYAEDEKGVPFINSPRYVGPTANMVKRQSDGRWVIAKGELDIAADVAAKYPFLANALAAKIVEGMGIGSQNANATTVAQTATVSSAPAKL